MRTFEYSDAKSNKFWNIDLQGSRYTVTFGKIGSKGQTQVKEFSDEETAAKAYDKVVAQKLGKGYVETTILKLPPPTPLQLSLEEALAENPDDLASHAAYADYLNEQGDPRGELIQVQLALENLKRSPQEVRRLEGHANAVIRVAFAADGKTILSCSSQYQTVDQTIRIWNVADGKEVRNFGGADRNRISVAGFAPDGKTALTDGPEPVLLRWKLDE